MTTCGRYPQRVGHGLFGMGSGGIWGKGVGMGMEATHLPERFTDFIFAIIGEEFGLLGTLIVIVLFTLLLNAGWRIARATTDPDA